MTAFSIDTYTSNHLEGMLRVYAAQTAHEPHIVPLSPDDFHHLVASKVYFDPSGLFVAHTSGDVLGWIHACVAPGTEPWSSPEPTAHIRMFFFPPERLAIGQALLREATAWLQARGFQKILAFSPANGYPFYRGVWMGAEPMLPYHLPHIHMALDGAGYHIAAEEIMMVCNLPMLPFIPAPTLLDGTLVELVDAPVTWAREAMRESWIGFAPQSIHATAGGKEVGHLGWALLPQLTARLGSPVHSIWGLGVDEAYRRCGIAAALIAHSLALGFAQGARFGSVGTQLWNTPAQKAYEKFGYRPYAVLGGRLFEK
jgi:ribosomal protein S18 acetylase RimI-like enzyme